MDKIVTVYCSSYEVDNKYKEAVREFARAASFNNIRVVCGGSMRGLMGVLIDEMNEYGGEIGGVIPHFMKEIEIEHKGLRDLVFVDTMSERKDLLRRDSDAIIAFPGGTGTLDEFIEAFVLKQVGAYKGKIILFDQDGFWQPLLALFDHFVRNGMLRSNYRDQLFVVSDVDMLIELIFKDIEEDSYIFENEGRHRIVKKD